LHKTPYVMMPLEHFAEHWCSKMKDKESLFAKCHTTVNPDSYYKVWSETGNLENLTLNFRYCRECYPTSHNKQWHNMSMCFQRCKYSSCTCEKSEECLCTVFSSYARACAAKGIFLQGWRGIVCGKAESGLFGRQRMGFQTRLWSVKNI